WAGRREQRGWGEELDGVAEPLFGREQNRALTDGKFAEPRSSAVVTARIAHAGALPPPFIFGKAARTLPEREQRQRHVRMRIGEILVDRDRLFETCHRIGVS